MRHRTCAAIHGDKVRDLRHTGGPTNSYLQDQRERERVLNDFRHGRVTTLIATDVAARGLGKYPIYHHHSHCFYDF